MEEKSHGPRGRPAGHRRGASFGARGQAGAGKKGAQAQQRRGLVELHAHRTWCCAAPRGRRGPARRRRRRRSQTRPTPCRCGAAGQPERRRSGFGGQSLGAAASTTRQPEAAAAGALLPATPPAPAGGVHVGQELPARGTEVRVVDGRNEGDGARGAAVQVAQPAAAGAGRGRAAGALLSSRGASLSSALGRRRLGRRKTGGDDGRLRRWEGAGALPAEVLHLVRGEAVLVEKHRVLDGAARALDALLSGGGGGGEEGGDSIQQAASGARTARAAGAGGRGGPRQGGGGGGSAAAAGAGGWRAAWDMR